MVNLEDLEWCEWNREVAGLYDVYMAPVEDDEGLYDDMYAFIGIRSYDDNVVLRITNADRSFIEEATEDDNNAFLDDFFPDWREWLMSWNFL